MGICRCKYQGRLIFLLKNDCTYPAEFGRSLPRRQPRESNGIRLLQTRGVGSCSRVQVAMAILAALDVVK
jgi:hypothetical protein